MDDNLRVYSSMKLYNFFSYHPIWFFVVLSDDVQRWVTIDSKYGDAKYQMTALNRYIY